MIKQFLKLKLKQKKIGVIYRDNRCTLDYIELKEPLYNNFYLTYLGIFRFDNPTYFHGSTVLNSPDLVLPKRQLVNDVE